MLCRRQERLQETRHLEGPARPGGPARGARALRSVSQNSHTLSARAAAADFFSAGWAPRASAAGRRTGRRPIGGAMTAPRASAAGRRTGRRPIGGAMTTTRARTRAARRRSLRRTPRRPKWGSSTRRPLSPTTRRSSPTRRATRPNVKERCWSLWGPWSSFRSPAAAASPSRSRSAASS